MLLSIVIPALNEEKTIGLVIDKALKSIRQLDIPAEIIIANNNSTDQTRRISLDHGAKVIDVRERGYGHALRQGLAAAQGQYLLMADADDSYHLEEIAPFIHKLNEGYDFVLGNRFKGHFIPGAMPALHRYLGTPVLTFIVNILFKLNIGDINCGMRAMRKDAYLRLECRSGGMEFASEMIVQAAIKQLKIAEIPCTLYKDKRERRPHLRPWQDGWRHLKLILQMKQWP